MHETMHEKTHKIALLFRAVISHRATSTKEEAFEFEIINGKSDKCERINFNDSLRCMVENVQIAINIKCRQLDIKHMILKKKTQGWISKNKDVDDCIKEFQSKVTKYEDLTEWIPFNRLDNIQKLG
ncbi:hypothetical protein C2G38_2191692 [Gigaspora rosea]|uniref:Uncharacterized protein n=1 Tax=Gigaspora rosea TaxID=44941 RepID=A0A397V1I1_9GLOM|nr:hypothetical protein C2G38_2191692 [Gigaspora rosea]